MPDHQLEFPRWFFCSEDVNEPKLLNLMVDVVFTPTSSLPDVSLCKDSSKDCIQVLLTDFAKYCATLGKLRTRSKMQRHSSA